eukprot:363235-Chlamydomonas_euryale.AAC.7
MGQHATCLPRLRSKNRDIRWWFSSIRKPLGSPYSVHNFGSVPKSWAGRRQGQQCVIRKPGISARLIPSLVMATHQRAHARLLPVYVRALLCRHCCVQCHAHTFSAHF